MLGIKSLPASPTLSLAPDFAHRLGGILAGLAALVARSFLRDPFRAPLILPLWKHLTRAARRLNRAFARLAAGHAPRPCRPHSAGPHRAAVLPTRRGWLAAALGPEAAAYASQIESLLTEPAAAAAVAQSLAARRTLAPIRRMLGLAAPRPRPLASPRPLREGLGEGFAPPAPAAAPRPIPPHWLRDAAPPPAARPWWLAPLHLRSD